MTREQELVRCFGTKGREIEALEGLAGGASATWLRTVTLTEAAFEALVEGLTDPNPRIRWWCIQVLDHVPDPRAIGCLSYLLDDPVPRVRRNAAHALGCVACKPDWDGDLPGDVVSTLARLAVADSSDKVRKEAAVALNRR